MSCAACKGCAQGSNLLNGRWCRRVKRYVEQDKKPPCGKETRDNADNEL